MLSLITYYRLMIAFFSYFTTGSELFLIVLIPMICLISYRSFGLYLATLGVIGDIAIASVGTHVSSNALKYTEGSVHPSSYERHFILYQYYGFPLLFFYVILRFGISLSEPVRDLWNKGSKLTKACYVIQLLFTGATSFLLILHTFVFVGWLFKTLSSLL